jgi:hypothetical protein
VCKFPKKLPQDHKEAPSVLTQIIHVLMMAAILAFIYQNFPQVTFSVIHLVVLVDSAY